MNDTNLYLSNYTYYMVLTVFGFYNVLGDLFALYCLINTVLIYGLSYDQKEKSIYRPKIQITKLR